MRDVNAPKACPGCGGTSVVKNGRRGGQQQYRCRTEKCRHQFGGDANAFRQHYPAEVIARSIEPRLSGKTYKETVDEIRLRSPRTSIPESTVHRWFEKYVSKAVKETRKLRVQGIQVLGIEYASLHPVEGGCWVVEDLETSCILVAQAQDYFESSAAIEVIETFRKSAGRLLEEDYYFTLVVSDREVEESREFADVVEAIKRELPSREYIPAAEIERFFTFVLDPHRAFRNALEILRRPKAFRSPESRQIFLDGWMVQHNFFPGEVMNFGDVILPARRARIEAPFQSWLDVVNYRVKAPARKPRRNK